jgi:single-strand DNA-binding protein
MPNYNRIVMIGHLTRDPQLSYTPNQTAVVDFGIATNRKWQDGSGQQREEVCFIDCRGFGKTAENINKFFQKGRAILVEGRLTFDQWEDKNGGGKRSKHRITVESWTFVGGDGQRNEPADQQQPTSGSQIPDSDIPF